MPSHQAAPELSLQTDDYFKGEEIQYELTHLMWEVNRIVDRRNFQMLRRFIERSGLEPEACLDIACGTGRTLSQLQGTAKRLVGVDLSHGLIRLAVGGKRVQADHVVGEASKLPFKDGAFDLVTINGALHHIEADYPTVHEAGRVLRSGGLLAILGEPNSCYMRWRNPFFALTMLYQRLVHPDMFAYIVRERRQRGFENVNPEKGAHNINPARLRQACSTANIRELTFHTYDYVPRLYSHARWAIVLYRALLAFEEMVLARVLPLHGSVLRYFGCKR